MQTLMPDAPERRGPTPDAFDLSGELSPFDGGLLYDMSISPEPMQADALSGKEGAPAVDPLAAIGSLMARQTLSIVEAEAAATGTYLAEDEAVGLGAGSLATRPQGELTLTSVGEFMANEDNENAFKRAVSGITRFRIGDVEAAAAADFARRQSETAKFLKLGEDDEEEDGEAEQKSKTIIDLNARRPGKAQTNAKKPDADRQAA